MYAVAGPYTSDILGNPVQIARMGTQIGLAASGPNRGLLDRSRVQRRARRRLRRGQPGGGFATKLNFGGGCYRSFGSFYENNGAFDMSNTSLQMINLGNSYLVQPGTATWHAATRRPGHARRRRGAAVLARLDSALPRWHDDRPLGLEQRLHQRHRQHEQRLLHVQPRAVPRQRPVLVAVLARPVPAGWRHRQLRVEPGDR